MGYEKIYEGICNSLCDRIFALIPDNPQILGMDNPFDLHKIEGFNCRDLNPSLSQAGAALSKAIHRYKERKDST